MKLILTLALALSTTAFANTETAPAMPNQKPFELPEGTYKMTCASSSIVKINDNEFRSSSHDVGQHSIRYVGNTIIMNAFMRSSDGKGSDFHDTTSIVRESLGDSKYRDTATSVTTFTDHEGKVQNRTNKWVRTFKVDGEHEINLTVQSNDEPERAGVGETSWLKISETVFVENNLQRGPSSRVVNGRVQETLASFSSCTHKLQKK